MRMSRDQIVRTAAISALILAVVVALDYIVAVVLMPGAAPYTPLTTIAITLAVAPAFVAYLIIQHAKVQRAHAALAEERVARLAADVANAAKTQFIANMSHELRTPLNAIIGYAEIIEEDNTEQSDDARRIQRAGRHLLGLINDILDHARIETGRLELCPAVAPLAPLMNEVAEAIRPAAEMRGVAVEVGCEADVGAAYVDPLRLKQCMLNLASNAAKFTHAGRITLTLSAGEADEIRFAVRDTGIGMSAATLGRLFEPFMQADASVTRDYGGTGLGLAITKQLIEAMGGRVAVESQEGVGSTFTLIFPRKASASAAREMAA